MDGGEITFNNVQGCLQAVADKINLNDVRLNNCHFVPEPRTGLLLGLGLARLVAVTSRRSSVRQPV